MSLQLPVLNAEEARRRTLAARNRKKEASAFGEEGDDELETAGSTGAGAQRPAPPKSKGSP